MTKPVVLPVCPGMPGEPARPKQFTVNPPPAYSAEVSPLVVVLKVGRPLGRYPVVTFLTSLL